VTSEAATVTINPRVVREVRERLNLSRAEAVTRVNAQLRRDDSELVDGQVIAAWESGSRPEVTVEQAEALARTLLLPISSLFDEEPTPNPLLDFRLAAGAKAANLSYETWEKLFTFDQFYRLARRIAARLAITEAVALPSAEAFDLSLETHLEHFAAAMRSALGISDELQERWETDAEARIALTTAVEALGVFVFSQPLNTAECRGASRWEAGGPPAILLPTADTDSARSFTLIHELSHLCLRSADGQTVICDPSRRRPTRRDEQIANYLAGAVLAPASVIGRLVDGSEPADSYRNWPYSQRRALKRALNVSHGVIGIRLEQLGIVKDAGVPKAMWAMPGRRPRGGGKARSVRYSSYLGARTLDLVKSAIDSGKASVGEVTTVLQIKSKDVVALLGA